LKLPSKKIIPLLVACLVAIVSISFAALYPMQAKQPVQENVVAGAMEQVSIKNTLTERDADEDGLKDWEESLWETDSNNKDTDGDGTLDGAEIKANRNPVKRGPKDSLETEKTTENSATTTPLSQTDKISRELFTKYMSLKQSGKELTPEIEQQLVDTIINQDTFNTLPERKYTAESFRIVRDTPESLRAYGNAIGIIIKKHAITERDSKGRFLHEVYILEQATENNSEAELDRLNTIIKSYENMLNELLKLEVPQGATTIHANLANGFSWSIQADKDFQLMFKDAAVSLAALSVYQKASLSTTQGFKDLRALMQKSGVVFGDSEPGYIVTTGMRL
jgi:hypothetical protein